MKLLMMWTCIIHSTPHIILAYLPQFGDWVDQPRVAEVHQDHCHCNEVNAKSSIQHRMKHWTPTDVQALENERQASCIKYTINLAISVYIEMNTNANEYTDH